MKLEAWIVDESRLDEGFHVNVIDRETDDQVMELLAYGLDTKEQAEKHLDYLKRVHDVTVTGVEIR